MMFHIFIGLLINLTMFIRCLLAKILFVRRLFHFQTVVEKDVLVKFAVKKRYLEVVKENKFNNILALNLIPNFWVIIINLLYYNKLPQHYIPLYQKF